MRRGIGLITFIVFPAAAIAVVMLGAVAATVAFVAWAVYAGVIFSLRLGELGLLRWTAAVERRRLAELAKQGGDQ